MEKQKTTTTVQCLMALASMSLMVASANAQAKDAAKTSATKSASKSADKGSGCNSGGCNLATEGYKCVGGVSCKGQSECKTEAHVCKGHNKCKGEGWVTTKNKEECDSILKKLKNS